MTLDIRHDPDAKKFYAVLDQEGEAYLSYAAEDGETLDYRSTFVSPELRGRGFGGFVVQAAMEYARVNNKKVIPSCPFVERWVEENPRYASLLADD